MSLSIAYLYYSQQQQNSKIVSSLETMIGHFDVNSNEEILPKKTKQKKKRIEDERENHGEEFEDVEEIIM